MKIKLLTLLIVSTICFCSCSGVKFAAAPTNIPLPGDFKDRILYESGIAAYTFEDLVGNVLLFKGNERPVRIGILTPNGFTPSAIAIPQNGSLNYYHSFIQKGAETQGSYLAFAADFANDQMAELTLEDIARADIPFTQASFAEITTMLTNWVQSHPKTDASIKRMWIKSVVLTTRLYTAGTKISASASAQIGSVVGVKSGIYSTNNETIKSTVIGFEAFDIDEFVGQLGAMASGNGGGFAVPIDQINTLINKASTEKQGAVIQGFIKADAGKPVKTNGGS